MVNARANDGPARTATGFRTGTRVTLAVSAVMTCLGILHRAGVPDPFEGYGTLVLAGGLFASTATILASRAEPGTLPLAEGLLRFAAFVAGFLASGLLLGVLDADALRPIGSGVAVAASVAAGAAAIWTLGILRVVGLAMLVGGIAAIAWIGGSAVHDLKDVLAMFSLMAIGAIVSASGGMLFANAP